MNSDSVSQIAISIAVLRASVQIGLHLSNDIIHTLLCIRLA